MRLLTGCKWALKVVHEIMPGSAVFGLLYSSDFFFILLNMFSTDVFSEHIFGVLEVTGF